MADAQDRLRDAFAQLMAQGSTEKAIPLEALMAAQGRQQFPRPRPNPNIDPSPTYNDDTVATPMQRAPGPDNLDFPTALPHGAGDERARPFHGKGIVAETTNRPWDMPKTARRANDKKNKKGKD